MIEWLRKQSAKMEAALENGDWQLDDIPTPDDFIDYLESTGASPPIAIVMPVQEAPPLVLPTDEEYDNG